MQPNVILCILKIKSFNKAYYNNRIYYKKINFP